MDLSSWMEPDPRFRTASLSWMNLGADGEIAGILAREAPHCLASALRLERCLGPEDACRQLECPGVLGIYCLSLAEGQAVHGLEKWSVQNDPPGRNEMLVSVLAAAALPMPDLLSPEAGAKAIEAIRAARPASPSKQWETLLAAHLERRVRIGDAPWTPDLPRLYRERWQEDAMDFLPYLWFQGPGAARFRLRFRSLVADLFEESFLKPLAAWCDEAGLTLAARFAPDDSLAGQILEGWGPSQRFFEWARVPGVAGIGAVSGAGASAILAFRQAVSAAMQFGAPADDKGKKPDFPAGVQCDLFTGLRGPGSLAALAAEAERRLAMGAGFLTVPDPTIPLRGDGKRSNGAALFHRAQPWWPEFEKMDCALGRLNALLSQGSRVTKLLVVVPTDSIAALAATPLPDRLAGIAGKSPNPNPQAGEIERLFLQMLQALDSYQIDYDLADEETIARHGQARANAFVVGAREYTTVAIPPAFAWRADMLAKLRRYARKGGSLILVKPLAEHADLEPSKQLEELAEEYPNVYVVERAGREVCAQVNRLDPAFFRIRTKSGPGAESLLAQHRRTVTHDLFFIVNAAEQDLEARVFLYADGAVRLFEPWSPRIFIRETDEERNALAFDFTFRAGAAALFAVGGDADLTEPPYQRLPHATSSQPLDDAWEFERLDPNLLPLTNCRWALGSEELSQEMPVEFARAAIREQTPESGVPVTLSFAFESELDDGERALEVILEPNAEMEILFNGGNLALDGEAGRLDPQFRRGNMAGKILQGANALVLRFPCGPDAVVEAPVLAGDFAVSRGAGNLPILTRERKSLRNGPLSKQGYPYYAGRMRFRQSLTLEPTEPNRYFLALQNPAGFAASMRIGERSPVWIPAPPYRLEITRLAQPGENTFEIELVSSLYNLYGPVHLSPKLLDAPDFSSSSYDERPFRDRQLWTRRPNLAPFGLLDGAALETYDPTLPPPGPPAPEAGTESDSESREEANEPEEPETEGIAGSQDSD